MSEPTHIASVIDHTLLKPEAAWEDVQRIVDEALRYRFASVCVNGVYVSRVAVALADSAVKTCAVVGFPLGAGSNEAVCGEAECAARDGADEIDFVAHVPMLLACDEDGAAAAFENVVDAARCVRDGVMVKAIFETAVLMRDADAGLAQRRIASACRAAKRAGCDFVKTSTGFHPAGGATVEAVGLLAQHADGMGVKASGGIRSRSDAMTMIEAGATRLGCSASVAIVEGE